MSSQVIRSQSDLSFYLQHTAGSLSPLDRLSVQGRQRFLASLTFSDKGLSSFRYGDLRAELTASQIYQVLSLFGAQQHTSAIPGVRVVTSADHAIMSGPHPNTDYPNYWCASHATCLTQELAICIGANC